MTSFAHRYFLPGLLGLLVLNAAVFWPVLTFDFVRWDDNLNITTNTLLTEPWSGSLLARFFDADQALRFKPLHWLLARGVFATSGFDPAAWHAFNLSFHLAATALFYVVLRQVLTLLYGYRTPSVANSAALPPAAELGALFGAALWSVHPLRTEVVAWATASPYPLSAVTLLAAFACYLRAHSSPASRGWLVTAWIFTVLAYTSYPVTVSFGLWLIAVDLWLLRPRSPDASESNGRVKLNWRKHACFLAPAALAVALTVWSRFATPGVFTTAPTVESVGVGSRILMGLASLSFLAGRVLWPFNLTPNVPPLTGSLFTPAVLSLAVIAGAVLALAWSQRRKRPLLALSCLGFAAICLPCLGLTERPTWPVDRYSYVSHLPLLGAIIVGIAMVRFTVRSGVVLTAVAGSFTLAFAVASRAQSTIWQDAESLFTHMQSRPDFEANSRQQGHVYLMWASHEAANARFESAAKHSQRAYQVYVTAMQRAVSASDYGEALALLTHVERHFGLTPVLQREKGAWLLRENRLAEAVQTLHEAAKHLPTDERLNALLRQAQALGAAPPPPSIRP